MNDFVIVPSAEREGGYVALSSRNRNAKGRVFRKHILSKGPLRHPVTGKTIDVNDDFLNTVVANFSSGVCPIVQVPLAGKNNEHVENPDSNVGEVIDVELSDEGKLYAILDVRDDKEADKFGKTYLGASAMLSLDYTDTRTGKKVGPTLLHSCVTNRPFVTDLEDYEELVAATADDSSEAVVLTSVEDPSKPPVSDDNPTPQEESIMDLDELLNTLHEEHDIDVRAMQAELEKREEPSPAMASLTDALTAAGVLKLTNGESVSADDVVGAVADLAETNVALSSRLENLERDKVEAEVDALVAKGFIAPAEKQARLELKLSHPELFDKLLPENPIIELSTQEHGFEKNDGGEHIADVDAEIVRYTNQAAEQGYVKAGN